MFRWQGNKISVSIYGTSHASEIGVKISGLPQETFDTGDLLTFLNRRKAGKGVFSTARIEADAPTFLSGVLDGKIVGEVHSVIYNQNTKSGDYGPLYGKPRPSHADYAAYCADGRLEFTGGGEFSGRMTAPFAVAGGIAKQLLQVRGITVQAYISAIGGIRGKSYKTSVVTPHDLQNIGSFPSLSDGERMLEEIALAKAKGDSVGGRVECIAYGMPKGVGGALFHGLESKIAFLLYAIPAVKGVEFGDGFSLAEMTGSRANDPLRIKDGEIYTETNRSGGINGGISNGMPVTLSVGFRPTPSISKEQNTVDLVKKENVTVQIGGRHDACIVPRAVPVVESAVALAILDSIL